MQWLLSLWIILITARSLREVYSVQFFVINFSNMQNDWLFKFFLTYKIVFVYELIQICYAVFLYYEMVSNRIRTLILNSHGKIKNIIIIFKKNITYIISYVNYNYPWYWKAELLRLIKNWTRNITVIR